MRCSDRAAAELVARERIRTHPVFAAFTPETRESIAEQAARALHAEQEEARQVIEDELAEQARQIAEDYAERRPVYLQIEVQGNLTGSEIEEIIDAVTNLAERYAGPDVAQVAWDVIA